MIEVLAVIAIIATLAGSLLPALASAVGKARATVCLNILRQIGITTVMCASDFQRHPDCLFIASPGRYVWPTRASTPMGKDRASIRSRIAKFNSSGDTNANHGLGIPRGVYTLRPDSRFSYRYNDWDAYPAFPRCRLGSDLDNPSHEIKDSQVRQTANMTSMVESRVNGLFDRNVDPTTPSEWPSRRHNRRCVIMFADGHAESTFRRDVVNPANESWHRRENSDGHKRGPNAWTHTATKAELVN